MASIPPTLSELQAWFLTVMIAPGGAQAGLKLAHSRYGLDEHELLRPAKGRRLAIYANGYVQRLLECLHADFPVLRKVMGDPLFNFFAKAYIWQHPSRSPTLYDLGLGFADFLQKSQPQGPNADEAMFKFPVELARLERARTEVMRAPGLERQTRIRRSDGFEVLLGQEMHLQLAPCTRLLALSWPLQVFLQHGLADGEAVPPTAQPEPCWVAVGRSNYRIDMIALEEWQFHYLQAAQHGAAVQQLALVAAEKSGLPVARVLADVLLWQAMAVGTGLLYEVSAPV